MKTKIGIIVPYRELKHIALEEVSKIEAVVVEVITAELDKALMPLREMEREGFHVIISRGGTTDLLKRHTTLPVLNIDISGYDILRTLLLLKESREAVKLIGFPNVCKEVEKVSNILNINIPYKMTSNAVEVDEAIEESVNKGITTIIGDTLTMKHVKKHRVRGVLIASGKESFIQTLYKAKEIGLSISRTKMEISSYQGILDTINNGVVIVTSTGKINYANSSWYAMFDRHSSSVFFQHVHPSMEEIFSLVSRLTSKIQKVISHNGHDIMVEGELSNDASNHHYIFKFTKMDQYSIKDNNLSISPLKTHINSFTQLKGVNKEVNQVIQTLKQNIHHSIFVLQGEKGTGKKTIAKAAHDYNNGNEKAIWRVQIKNRLSDISLQLFISMLFDNEGTYYMEGWEFFTPNQLAHLVDQLPNSSNMCVFGTSNPTVDNILYSLVNADNILTLPPLRNRMEHLEEYCKEFIIRYNNEFNKQISGISANILKLWKQEQWSGNLTQLNEVIRQTVYDAKGDYIELNNIRRHNRTISTKAIDVSVTLKEIEHQVVKIVLEEENHNQTRTAERLGINRATLWRKLKELR